MTKQGIIMQLHQAKEQARLARDMMSYAGDMADTLDHGDDPSEVERINRAIEEDMEDTLNSITRLINRLS